MGTKPKPIELTGKDIARFWSKVAKGDGCWEWLSTLAKPLPYGRFWLKNGQAMAHRVSFVIANGNIDEGMHVCHKCDNPKCVNPSHLFLGTCKENVRDCCHKGRRSNRKGDRNPMAKLSNADVKEIISSYKSGEITQKKLGERYGVSNKYVSAIVTGYRWKCVGIEVGLVDAA